MSDDDGLPHPPADWWINVVANPDIEVTKLMILVGILAGLGPTQRARTMRYLNERFESV